MSAAPPLPAEQKKKKAAVLAKQRQDSGKDPAQLLQEMKEQLARIEHDLSAAKNQRDRETKGFAAKVTAEPKKKEEETPAPQSMPQPPPPLPAAAIPPVEEKTVPSKKKKGADQSEARLREAKRVLLDLQKAKDKWTDAGTVAKREHLLPVYQAAVAVFEAAREAFQHQCSLLEIDLHAQPSAKPKKKKKKAAEEKPSKAAAAPVAADSGSDDDAALTKASLKRGPLFTAAKKECVKKRARSVGIGAVAKPLKPSAAEEDGEPEDGECPDEEEQDMEIEGEEEAEDDDPEDPEDYAIEPEH